MKGKLPLPPEYTKVDDYVEALLSFITSSDLLQKLCGGVHILDFLTREPDLYNAILPKEWRDWFQIVDISDILDLLMREDIKSLMASYEPNGCVPSDIQAQWRGHPLPPLTLFNYINDVRRHSLDRTFRSGGGTGSTVPVLVRNVSVGMKPKKIHEVENFSSYINKLTKDLAHSNSHDITHIVDFGSGQNYLGRALGSEPYNKHIIAVESKQLNINGAMDMDVTAKLAKKDKIMRNKKEYRREESRRRENGLRAIDSETAATRADASPLHSDAPIATDGTNSPTHTALSTQGGGGIQYVEHLVEDGNLEIVCKQISPSSNFTNPSVRSCSDRTPQSNGASSQTIQLMVISLHSCGNLLHHGLRSLILNPCVKAVAMVGCCYNLVTERLGAPTFKLPTLRPPHPRLDRTSSTCDPHGFPMSERLARYQHQHGEGIRLNITARMMAVQAPQNWTAMESEAFFTRHFYRALLQRILLDRGLVEKPMADDDDVVGGGSPRGWSGAGRPIVIGSLRKTSYTSFTAYVRGAVAKIAMDQDRGSLIAAQMAGLTDEAIVAYEKEYRLKRKELSIVWSLMAFSAGVVESTIVVDRWLYLQEQKEVKDCWVEIVFDYKQSPRNLVVVGIKH